MPTPAAMFSLRQLRPWAGLAQDWVGVKLQPTSVFGEPPQLLHKPYNNAKLEVHVELG